MNAYIYRCTGKNDMYIYIKEKDNFSDVPDHIKKSLGQTEFSLEVDITPDKKLAKEDPVKVLANLDEHGFHLQLPSEQSIEDILTEIAQQSRKN